VNTWGEHLTTALLGTRRRAVPDLPEGASGGGDPAGRLLDQAAFLTLRRRAGRPGGRAEPIAPAPAETAPIVGPPAARRLRQILGGEHGRLLPEWLEAAARSGLRVPPRSLPELLDKGRADRALRPAIARAAGRRGVWLAMRNIDWAYLVAAGDGDAAQDPEHWETGTRIQRAAHLTWLRAADPARAVATLRTTWATDSAPDRTLFLGTFEKGLSAGDEEFLEAALDDRGQDVRRIAADLLARLPNSAYGRRMADRARTCLRIVRPDAAPDTIDVHPPDDHDEAMRRDGIPFHAVERIGTRAGWLREILARAPLPIWAEILGRTPAEIVRMPVADHDARTALDVHLGWARAAVRQRDPEWARGLLNADVLLGGSEIEILAGLLNVLPAGERDREAATVIGRIGNGPRPELITLLGSVPGPWAGALAGAVIAALSAGARVPPSQGLPGPHTDLTELCRLADERLSPATAPQVDEIAQEHPGTRALTDLARTLRFRRDMLTELSA
jgi:hypothetical protein